MLPSSFLRCSPRGLVVEVVIAEVVVPSCMSGPCTDSTGGSLNRIRRFGALVGLAPSRMELEREEGKEGGDGTAVAAASTSSRCDTDAAFISASTEGKTSETSFCLLSSSTDDPF